MIPEAYAKIAAELGDALRASFANPVAEATPKSPLGCASGGTGGYLMIEVPAGSLVDALIAAEDLAFGQVVTSYSVEVPTDSMSTWTAVASVHGGTVGAQVVDAVPAVN